MQKFRDLVAKERIWKGLQLDGSALFLGVLHLNKFLLQQSQKGAYASYLPHFLQGKREVLLKEIYLRVFKL